jgi:hypothetical protein
MSIVSVFDVLGLPQLPSEITDPLTVISPFDSRDTCTDSPLPVMLMVRVPPLKLQLEADAGAGRASIAASIRQPTKSARRRADIPMDLERISTSPRMFSGGKRLAREAVRDKYLPGLFATL